jgi:hypothetical protein
MVVIIAFLNLIFKSKRVKSRKHKIYYMRNHQKKESTQIIHIKFDLVLGLIIF